MVHDRRWRRRLVALLAAVVLAGCGTTADDGRPATTNPPAPPGPRAPAGTITVAAASSLGEAFTRIGAAFEEANPGTHVRFTFDSSTTLASQLSAGAPADVFASADQGTMADVARAPGLEGRPEAFARNRMIIVAKPGNPRGIGLIEDLAHMGTVALCVESAPCGRVAATILDRAGVHIPERSITRGQNAAATLAAVRDGDATAGLVYASDALSAGYDVATIQLPDDQNVTSTYPIAVVHGTDHRALAEAFVSYVRGPAGQAVLAESGFLSPP